MYSDDGRHNAEGKTIHGAVALQLWRTHPGESKLPLPRSYRNRARTLYQRLPLHKTFPVVVYSFQCQTIVRWPNVRFLPTYTHSHTHITHSPCTSSSVARLPLSCPLYLSVSKNIRPTSYYIFLSVSVIVCSVNWTLVTKKRKEII